MVQNVMQRCSYSSRATPLDGECWLQSKDASSKGRGAARDLGDASVWLGRLGGEVLVELLCDECNSGEGGIYTWSQMIMSIQEPSIHSISSSYSAMAMHAGSRVLLQQNNSSSNIANTTPKKSKTGKDVTTSPAASSSNAPRTRAQHLTAAATGVTPLATPNARLDRSIEPSKVEDSKGSWRSWTRGEGLQPSELDIANLPEVRRKANVCQLCE